MSSELLSTGPNPRGRHNWGERNGRAKLTGDAVREIRRRYKEEDVTQKALADEYGVSPSIICHAIQRKTWKHID